MVLEVYALKAHYKKIIIIIIIIIIKPYPGPPLFIP